MIEGKQLFIDWIDKIRNDVKNTAFESFVPAQNELLVAELMQLKTFIVEVFVNEKKLLLKDWKLFEAELWRRMKSFVKERLHLLENVYLYEQNAAYNEAILESVCSAAKHVFKEGMTTKTFLETLVNYLYLNENLEQREWIVEAVTDFHIIRYDHGGENRNKRLHRKGDGR